MQLQMFLIYSYQHMHKQVVSIYIKLLRHVSMLMHHLQGVYNLL